MDDKDERELERRKLTDEVRQTVEHELKRRYSWIGLIVAVIMSSLITLTVREILYPARVQMEVMKELQKQATVQLANTSSQLANTSLQSEKLNTQFKELLQTSEILKQRLVEGAQANLGFTDDLSVKMAELSGVVLSLNAKVNELIVKKPGTKTVGNLQPRIGKIEKGLRLSREDIEKARKTMEKTAQRRYLR